MANQIRTVDLLPEIFQTPVNRQFLNATLDQLVQNPQFNQTQGFIGRRVGPGVNANDGYVVEPTKTRRDYQLEPGVVQSDPADSRRVVDAITYPGINDALALQGANVSNTNSLYTSDYYTWDPFIDFDKFVNYAQYYWLPGGPLAVDVFSGGYPLTDSFTVTRANGVYTFSGYASADPAITLVRGGNYTFDVAQNQTETENFRVTNNSTSWAIDYQANPTLTLVRGNTYVFNLIQTVPWAFFIKTEISLGTTNLWSSGVTNNGASSGLLTFTVPQDAPDTLYYCNDTEFNFSGQFNIVDGTSGTGPGFWIQTDPGVNGRIPATPNISSRDVLGVINNGEDLGTVTFNVPLATAQNFYYDMPSIGTVDLVTSLQFDQINNQTVSAFFETYPTGIDGTLDLNNRTIVFNNQNSDPETGGWQQTTFFDPLLNVGNTVSGVGSFDSQLFDQSTYIVDQTVQYSVWQIQYLTAPDGEQYISLASILPVAELNKFTIAFGTEYSSTNWYKNEDGFFEQMPLLTATKNVLFYQDGTDPNIFGQIRIIDQALADTIDVSEIIGQPNYTSPNGVIFSNGMKVVFRGAVSPTSYQNNTYYVEGVGTAIQLLPTVDYVTPETYVDSTTANQPIVPDYLTINRASPDLNAWSRSNRWFHIDIINASAEYNNTVPVLDNNFRAARPILEYRGGTRLFDYGTSGKPPVDIIDFSQTDALSNVNGQSGYTIDGYQFVNGSRVIFAADTDPEVRKTIYTVQFISPDTVAPLIEQPIIALIPAAGGTVLFDQSVLILSGDTEQGLTYYFDGVDWLESQQKISVNQPPLFDVYDANGISFGNRAIYPSSTFVGTPLFSYAIGNVAPDLVLGFPLTYLSLTNVGDIVFDNNFYSESFNYTIGSVGKTISISTGFVRQYSDRITYKREIGWQPAATTSLVRQQFQFTYDGSPLLLDVAVNANDVVPAIQIFINDAFIELNQYTVTVATNTTTINLLNTYTNGDIVEVLVLSDQVSKTGFYEVPINLENNPLNGNSTQFTLGTIRNHYSTIAENLIGLSGPVIGANNTRDLGNIIPYGLQILQQSSPLTLAGYFMRDPNYNIFDALEYNSREYIKFKSLLLQTVTTFSMAEYTTLTVAQLLDSAIAQINSGDTNLTPFYWSDMLPTGPTFTSSVTTVNPITTAVFNLNNTYSYTTSSYQGLLVYVNNVLLTRGYDYVVSTDGPTLTITIPLTVGDIVTINEYSSTAGNFVPNTPTKLGLYPKYQPKIFVDTDYVNPTTVIQGHDGSITMAFGDIRDQVLLEFEKRIFNNLKNDDNPPPLVIDDVLPGFFRTTDYTLTDINQILGEEFLTWVGYNKLDYNTQTYIANNEFTYNYSQAGNKLNGDPLLGAWRGIYRYFYDTLTPNITPWEMLGLSEEPTWWADRYGPLPYTSDNLVLWGDLEAGYVADPVVPYINPKYIRPGLTQVIPVNSQGELLSPLDSVTGSYNQNGFVKSWQVGDGGPVEASWWMSSSYPFAVMRLLILTRPAEFFSLFADRDLYRYDTELEQYLYNGRYRIQPQNIQVYGNGVSKASYIDWIVDYNRQFGINSTDALTTDLANIDVRLCYRAASFIAQQNLNLYLEKSNPNSQNSSLLIPPESYNLLLYKNQPFNKISYSAVIVEIVDDGYSVYGYNNIVPYFPVLSSKVNGISQTVSAGNTSITVPSQYSDSVVKVPYGYTFSNRASLVDFLLSYGAYLNSQGMSFTVVENGYTLNWLQMAQEFLYFSNQGWATGTIINLNPSATQVSALRPGAVVDNIVSYTPENMILDQNRQVVESRNLVIQRDGDSFSVGVVPGRNQTISFLQLKFTDYEDMVVLDNRTIFNDLVYNTITAERQSRLRLVAATSADWNGTLDAQGFILNQNNVVAWKPNTKYTKGEIVIYKNGYWQASTIVQPKEKFEYSDWYKSNYNLIQQGLLQNLATKADQLANSYDTHTANLNNDNDLLAYGLIGFQPRQYMVDLDLSDTSQVNLYQEFIKTKGTLKATDLFTNVNFNKETGQYNIYENWGILVGTYGANANRSWFEVDLNEAALTGNPSTIQIVIPGESSIANQAVLLNNLWAESYKIPTTDILPTTYTRDRNTALPSAGYVNIDDVDITVFNLNNPSNIAANLDTIGNGTRIWVAQDNSYNWNIYQCVQVPGRIIQITDNLNGTSVAQFSSVTNLSVGDLIIVRYFDTAIDGVYRVLSTPGINTVVIEYAFVNTNQTSITGTGIAFYLQTMRVAQASDVINLPYTTQLIPGATAWVDNDGFGHWEVIQKQNPFSQIGLLTASTVQPNALYGSSLAQSADHFALLVGSPAAESGAGAVYTYRQDSTLQYVENLELILTATDSAGYGTSVDFGDRTWSVVGAPASNSGAGYATPLYLVPGTTNYVQTQLLVAPDQDFSAIGFGTSVQISDNERWMYISAPAANRVYAYNRVDIPVEIIKYTTNGVTATYTYNTEIQIDSSNPAQLTVSLGNFEAKYGIDYIINATLVQFFYIPAAGQELVIARRQSAQLDYSSYYNLSQNSTSGTGTNATFNVTNTRGTYTVTPSVAGLGYVVGNTITISYTQIDPAGSAANNLTITVTSVDGIGGITGFTYTGSGISNTSTFNLATYLYTATNIYSFTIIVDGVLQRPYIDYTFSGTTVTFITNPPTNSVITATTGTYWQYVDLIEVNGIDSAARFGTSITTDRAGTQILIGAPNDTVLDSDNQLIGAGAVYAIDRGVVRYIVADATNYTYAIPGSYNTPVSVVWNRQYLTNSAQFIDGQFTVSGSNIVLSSDITLTIGDIIEIDTNQFQLVQKIQPNNPIDESAFGQSIDICYNNCSVYTGAPLDSSTIVQGGLVQRNVNQSRVYGVTTSTVANPTLTGGDTIRINNTEVAVPDAPNNTIAGLVNAINTAKIPNIIATSSTDVYLAGDGSTKIFDIGNMYSAASSYNTVVYVDDVLQTVGVNYTYNNSTQQIAFVSAPAYGAVIKVVSGKITINVISEAAAIEFNKLTVLPGVAATDSTVGSAFADIGFVTYPYTQTITSPNPTDYARFGSAVSVNTNAVNLVVGAPNGNIYEPTIFDGGETYFDDRSTTFFNSVVNSGVAYTFDYLPSSTTSVTSPGKFVFGQQIYSTDLATGDQFGFAVNYRSQRLLVGAPGSDLGDSTGNYGQVAVLDNPTDAPVWTVIHAQQPSVDVALLNSVYSYNRLATTNQAQTYFDFIDPLQGKILGVARRNIDYIGAVDPANYNTGTIHNIGTSWGESHVGQIWWDTNSVRFIDPNQDNIAYASRRWSQVFPGSTIDIYQWIESTVPPANYAGSGTPLSATSYTVKSSITDTGILVTNYYFWVIGLATVATAAGKTLSATAIASYILNPIGSGLPYIAGINANTVAVYNVASLLSANDTILHVEYDRQVTGSNADIHTEYQFIADGRADAFLNANLYRKLLDSLCGNDVLGNAVPDPLLSTGLKYGVEFRPRQSMFVDRFVALQNYLGRANTILAQYPISETRSFNLLNSEEPIPAANSGAWDYEVPNLEILAYQDLALVPYGYLYLVLTDTTQNGLWTIYQVVQGAIVGSKELALVRVQNYDTKLYWDYINWYLPGYNSSIQPLATVQNSAGLQTLSLTTVPVGGSAKVTANGQGKYEIYLRTDLGWDRVGLEDGTVEFKEELWNYSLGMFGFDSEVFDAQYFDQEPVIETRQIIKAINDELFIGDLLIERNQLLMLMFQFIYTEFTNPHWLIKTSYIDVDHVIRGLLPYQLYQPDNQTFVLDYLNEVKPYHVQNLAFNLIYDGSDNYPGLLTDYDVPAYWNTTLDSPQFVSPILTPYTDSNSLTESFVSDAAPNAQVWLEQPWAQWFGNYLLEIEGVTIINGGSGYTTAPEVTVTGDCITPAVLTAIINSSGRVVGVNIIDPGYGYTTTASITFSGTVGSGATGVAQMGNGLVRSIKTTIKYDRYQYSTSIVEWQANVTYIQGSQVRWSNAVWEADVSGSSATFIPDDWTLIDAADLSGVDRTMGYYVPGVNMPGLQLPLLIDGIDYPGVQVTAPTFSQNTGFDVGNFDINPFDNIAYGPEGQPTYSPEILDAIYSSSYLDTYLGTRPSDINVDGGAYVDTFSSHAPEELIPGSEFDTLDFRVYTTPGSDWLGLGHGFPIASRRYVYNPDSPTLSFDGALANPMVVELFNVTLGLAIQPLSYNWPDYEVTVDPTTARSGDTILVYVTGVGGGNQLYLNTYNEAALDSIVVPFTTPAAYSSTNIYNYGNVVIYNNLFYQAIDYFFSDQLPTNPTYWIEISGASVISDMLIYNGQTRLIPGVDYNYYAILGTNNTQVVFNETYGITDRINLLALGYPYTGPNYSWSLPVFQTVVVTDSEELTYTLTNSLQGTNPVNIIVVRNGVRARPSEGERYIGDGSTVSYDLPSRGGYSEGLITDSDIAVYLNNELQTQITDYVVDAWDGSTTRTITFVTAPAEGSVIIISVRTAAQYWITGDQLTFRPEAGLSPQEGDLLEFITWNDTSEQGILTQVFVGPTESGIIISEGYDSVDFDSASSNNTSGSYDYSIGSQIETNVFDTGTIIENPERIFVTIDGEWLFNGLGFTVDGSSIIILGPAIPPQTVVAITSFTQSVVPGAMEFRIFQDMRGVQATYRMTPSTTTVTTQSVAQDDDVIYVGNILALTEPNFAANIWGVITIDAERIMYRYWDEQAGTVSGLLRGTAGTAASAHASGATVYNLGRGNLLPEQYQDYIVTNSTLGDGSTTVFTADDINLLLDDDSTTRDESLEVYVGGTRVTTGYTVTSDNPAEITFTEAPPAGAEVTMLVRRGVTWYQQGAGTASNGIPLQETNTMAARFLRGL